MKPIYWLMLLIFAVLCLGCEGPTLFSKAPPANINPVIGGSATFQGSQTHDDIPGSVHVSYTYAPVVTYAMSLATSRPQVAMMPPMVATSQPSSLPPTLAEGVPTPILPLPAVNFPPAPSAAVSSHDQKTSSSGAVQPQNPGGPATVTRDSAEAPGARVNGIAPEVNSPSGARTLLDVLEIACGVAIAIGVISLFFEFVGPILAKMFLWFAPIDALIPTLPLSASLIIIGGGIAGLLLIQVIGLWVLALIAAGALLYGFDVWWTNKNKGKTTATTSSSTVTNTTVASTQTAPPPPVVVPAAPPIH